MYKLINYIFIILLLNNILYANDIKDFNFIKSHEVIYDLNIENITSNSKIHNAVGKMNLKVQEVCDGWVVNQNTFLDITDKNGLQVRNEFRNSSWESYDFKSFKFMSQTIVNGEEVSYYEGEADLDKNLNKVIFLKPYVKELTIPKDTIFPMQHYISTYRNKSNFQSFNVFFGEDDESINHVTSFTSSLTINEILYKKVRTAVFNYQDTSSKPIYEIELIIDNDGMVHQVVFDYLDYKIVGRILKSNIIKQKAC